MSDGRTHIRDPLNGDVFVRPEERAVLDSDPVQRLRYVGQIGYAQTVWPGATHTRFVHSIGVLEAATKIAQSVDLPPDEVTNVRLAALLHDVGHGPFSHVSDHVTNARSPVHEARSCRVIDDLAGLFPPEADPERVKAYVRSDAPLDEIAGTIDADRLDYIRRDAANAGLEGTVDIDTITRFVGRRDDQLYFRRPALRGIETLLTARYALLEDLHHNKTSAIARTMLRRAIERFFAANPDADVLDYDDRTMHAALLDADDDAARYYYERFSKRDLFKRAYHVGTDDVDHDRLTELAEVDPRAVERAISEEVGIDQRRVLVHPPELPDSEAFDVRIEADGDLRRLTDVSRFPETLAESEWHTVDLGVYAPGSVAGPVRRAARAVLDGRIDVDEAVRTRARGD